MAPLATTMVKESGGWLTFKDIKLLTVCNVALAIPARIFIGMLHDKYGPRRCYTALMVLMAIPCIVFAFGDTKAQLVIARLFLGLIGASFSIGIHMTALWFKPKDIGFAEGIYGGWGNFGAAGAAMIIPWIAISFFGGPDGWRYAMAANAMVLMAYGIVYYFVVTDGPDTVKYNVTRQTLAMEVGTRADMIKLIAVTVPLFGILAVVVWKIYRGGFIGAGGSIVAYGVIIAVIIYQIIQIIRVNRPILDKGVPEDDKYPFGSVIALNSAYFVTFGAELAVVSMLPAFFETTWALSPAKAGLIASSFAFLNIIARPLGGYLSDRFADRRLVLVVFMFGIAFGFFLMGLITEAWPIIMATAAMIFCSFFVQGGSGATFAMVPMVKRRLTGQISGMVGAYGIVGAVVFTVVYASAETANQFFFLISGAACLSFVICMLMLKEPHGSFADEYHLSSVDKEIRRHNNTVKKGNG